MVVGDNQRGFTLVETMCAFAMASVLALTLVHTGHGKAQSVSRAFQETLALRLAQAEIESIRANPADQPIGQHIITLPTDTTALFEGGGMRTVREVRPHLLEVEVEMHWQPPGAQKSRSVILTTRIARKELRK